MVPGWAEGTLRVEAWGENTNLTVIGSQLNISKSEALPNELLTITGDNFSTDSDNFIAVENIKIDGVALTVHGDSETDGKVDVSSSGQFVASIILWSEEDTNPTRPPASNHQGRDTKILRQRQGDHPRAHHQGGSGSGRTSGRGNRLR